MDQYVKDLIPAARAQDAKFVTWFETNKAGTDVNEADWRMRPHAAAVAAWSGQIGSTAAHPASASSLGQQVLVELALEVGDPGGGVGVEHPLLREYDDPPAGPLEGHELVRRHLMGEYGAELAAIDPEGEAHQPVAGRDRHPGHRGREVGRVPVEAEHRLGQAQRSARRPGPRASAAARSRDDRVSRDSSARSSVCVNVPPRSRASIAPNAWPGARSRPRSSAVRSGVVTRRPAQRDHVSCDQVAPTAEGSAM